MSFIDKIPKIKLAQNPTKICPKPTDKSQMGENINSYAKLAKMMGIESKNEYSNASSLFTPSTSAEVVVLPLRLSPGNIASP